MNMDEKSKEISIKLWDRVYETMLIEDKNEATKQCCLLIIDLMLMTTKNADELVNDIIDVLGEIIGGQSEKMKRFKEQPRLRRLWIEVKNEILQHEANS